MQTSAELKNLLQRIDHKGYPAYKDTRGSYEFPGYVLSIDHVQGDPFAAPSKVSIHVRGKQAGFPEHLYQKDCRRTAVQDYLLRQFARQVEKVSFKAKGSGKSGLMAVSCPGQEVLERSACQMDAKNGDIVLRMEIGFPANGRTVNSRELEKIFFDFLPECVKGSLYFRSLRKEAVEAAADLAEDQAYIREQLDPMGLCAFVADGAILPRESGVSGRPMKDAVRFQSPESLSVTLTLPHHGKLIGMGIRKGITLIVGGGYHGKSTLLKALETGVYNHIAGDGREYVITDDTAMKIRAEDGRSIRDVDISMFIHDLPNGKDTVSFYTEDASGSTSQAANVIEGIESGTSLFLIDEDTCATNFMIRDELMQRVVCREEEPITPFIERARFLYETCGISSIIVAGSSGSYFHIADAILQMDRYVPRDITAFAKKEAALYADRNPENPEAGMPQILPDPALPSFRRAPGYNPALRRDDRLKHKAHGRETIQLGHETIDLRYLEQLADTEQTAALSFMLALAEKSLFNGQTSMKVLVDSLLSLIEKKGLEALSDSSYLPTDLAVPRRQEIFSCFNRYRGLKL